MSTTPVPVAYLGPDGTFASEAVRRLRLLPSVQPMPLGTVGEVIDAVDSGAFEFGVVPFENSVEGVVTPTLDRLVFRARRVLAVEEVVVPVRFTAWVAPAHADWPGPWQVTSHPHALAQCTAFVEKCGGSPVAATSTAQACVSAAEADHPIVALAAPSAGTALGLVPLATDVEDHPGAATRFLLLGTAVAPPEGDCATLLVVTPPSDRTGVLHDLLAVFARRGLALSALTVRPLRRVLGLYTFVLTIRAHVRAEPFQAAVREVLADGHSVKLLGSYRESPERVEAADAPPVPAGSAGAADDTRRLFDPPMLTTGR